MATISTPFDQLQATQKQLLDSLMENYQKMVQTLTPEHSPARTFYTLGMEYMGKMRELTGSVNLENPQGFMDSAVDMMKKSSELNMEYSTKYMNLYKEFFQKYSLVSVN